MSSWPIEWNLLSAYHLMDNFGRFFRGAEKGRYNQFSTYCESYGVLNIVAGGVILDLPQDGLDGLDKNRF